MTRDLGGAGAGRQTGATDVTLGRENVDLDSGKSISGGDNGAEMRAWQSGNKFANIKDGSALHEECKQLLLIKGIKLLIARGQVSEIVLAVAPHMCGFNVLQVLPH